MSAHPDDLDKLLSDVRCTINENRRFLKTLLEDSVEEHDEEAEDSDAEENDEGAFEEL